MSDVVDLPWPGGEPGVHHLGLGVFLRWDADGRGFIWHHPACRPWATLRLKPDPQSTGHELVAGGPEDMEHLTIQGSLLCPMGCGLHGVIEGGRWKEC